MGISVELFIQPQEEVAVPMDTFFMRMKPVPSPYLVKGRLSESAKRGKKLFTEASCNYCHPAPLFTDMKFHNCGVEDPWDANVQWDSPSIIEAWRTGPYGHLGSYDNIEDIIILKGHSQSASELSPEEVKDLVEYNLSL
jgi:cytochrome c peroxidase